jgi:hypothetical protein
MVIIMDSGTGKTEDSKATFTDFGKFDDEVLNAGWLPRLEIQSYAEIQPQHGSAPAVADADAFLRKLYCSQE